jgi:class 3 adenylate cyclase
VTPRIQRRTLREPDRALAYEHGSGEVVRIGELSVGRARLEPGWRWSVDIQPLVGTASCQLHHVHVVLAGSFAARLDDGETVQFIAGDVCDIPPGHDAWVVGDETVDLLDISGNVDTFGIPPATSTAVLTMLMTDIVASTETAERLGGAAWRQVLERHHRLVRSQLDRFAGTEVDTTGDGFLATFASASSAVACARAVRDTVASADLRVRIGLHTGEVELTRDGLRGVAVHATARVMATAGASEIVVSGVTRALATGAAATFRPLGRRELKGIAEPVDLFAVDDPASDGSATQPA